MRNKLGIIQLELPDITLDIAFGNGNNMEITSLLSEEQKEIITTLGGSKLVLLKANITDVDDNNHLFNGLLVKDYIDKTLTLSIYSSVDAGLVTISLCEISGKYYIYS